MIVSILVYAVLVAAGSYAAYYLGCRHTLMMIEKEYTILHKSVLVKQNKGAGK